MLHRRHGVAAVIFLAACADRAVTPPSIETSIPAISANAKRPEALAKQVAMALKNPALRAYLRAQLEASPYPEHKLQFQTFLATNGGRALREVAAENQVSKEALSEQAKSAIALEVYFPVPEHRAAWAGDERLLVATALTDDDPPIAFDTDGRRQVLDPATPPATPVLALVPVGAKAVMSRRRHRSPPGTAAAPGGPRSRSPPVPARARASPAG